MTQCNRLNVELSNLQQSLQSLQNEESKSSFKIIINFIGNDETNFPHKLLSTNRQVANLRKALGNNLSTDIKLSKTQLSKIIQLGGFLGRLLVHY